MLVMPLRSNNGKCKIHKKKNYKAIFNTWEMHLFRVFCVFRCKKNYNSQPRSSLWLLIINNLVLQKMKMLVITPTLKVMARDRHGLLSNPFFRLLDS